MNSDASPPEAVKPAPNIDEAQVKALLAEWLTHDVADSRAVEIIELVASWCGIVVPAPAPDPRTVQLKAALALLSDFRAALMSYRPDHNRNRDQEGFDIRHKDLIGRVPSDAGAELAQLRLWAADRREWQQQCEKANVQAEESERRLARIYMRLGQMIVSGTCEDTIEARLESVSARSVSLFEELTEADRALSELRIAWNEREPQLYAAERKIEELTAALAAANRRADEMSAEKQAVLDQVVKLKELHMVDGAMEAHIEQNPEVSKLIATAFASMVAKSVNYTEMHFTPAEANGTRITVLVQKHTGKTPHELRRIAETRLQAADALIVELREAFGICDVWPLCDVLTKLCEAVHHLRDAHNCDGDGHEQFFKASEEAEKLLPRIRAALSKTSSEPAATSMPPSTTTQSGIGFVLIDQCPDRMMWYVGLVGKPVALARPADHDADVFWAREGGTYNALNIIRKADAHVVDDPASQEARP